MTDHHWLRPHKEAMGLTRTSPPGAAGHKNVSLRVGAPGAGARFQTPLLSGPRSSVPWGWVTRLPALCTSQSVVQHTPSISQVPSQSPGPEARAPFSHTCHLSPRAGLPDGLPLLSPSASSLCTPRPAPDHRPSLCAATVPPATSPPEVECAVSGKCVQIFRNYTKKNRK